MKKTLASLYVLILVTLLGFGALIDRFYSEYLSTQQTTNSEFEVIFKALIEEWNRTQSIDTDRSNLFQIDDIMNFPLPEPLNHQLMAGESIILDSDSGISLHQLTDDPAQVFSMGPIPVMPNNSRSIELSLTLLFYLSVGIALLVWIRPLTRGVSTLSLALKNLGHGELETRLKERSLYLQDLFNDFNSTASQLEIASSDNRLFSQAVSHDLRTPLSRIEFALESLDQNLSEFEYKGRIKKIRSDINTIDLLARELLDYARIGQTRQVNFEPIDVIIFLQQIIAEFSFSRCQIDFNTPTERSLDVNIDTSLFHKLLRNLIDNATQHAKDKVSVSVYIDKGSLIITVEDDGPGIDESVSDSLFQPFCQGKATDKKRFGLGLAICERVVRLHSGRITADNQSILEGARLQVRIPVLLPMIAKS
ncbi:MAG: signal transduction histidine kinase [Gammaproteobacteria bacterium]|jgi:signal transduction histidine kinase